ncbi:MAG: flagellar hook-basal body complex protein [Gammaproteobacteria bacterium]|nr:flagellar hook-basal body complex protein [Gammaproteobacteria bacterium]
MIGSIFNGMSGLLAFSKGLSTISSNVSNMNTPGYKSSELQFLDVFYRSNYSSLQNGNVSFSQTGNGVETGSTTTNFNQGELRATGNELDVAVDGDGFIVLRKDNENLYTRAGQFEFDEHGFLVSRINGARVAALTESGKLYDINRNDFSRHEQLPTSYIQLAGILDTSKHTGTISDPEDADVVQEDIKVFDALGKERTLKLEFELTNNTGGSEWQINVLEGSTSLAIGTVKFDLSGNPVDGQNTMQFIIKSDNDAKTEISIRMEDPVTESKVQSLSGGDSLSVSDVDGYGAGALLNNATSIDEKGYLNSSYSNGQSIKHARLALASFLQLHELEQSTSGMFIANNIYPTLGHANDDGLGKFSSRTIELSNVELTQQFGDLIIVQRGYQASSQVLTVSNEMLQQLIEMRGRG